MLQSVTRQRAWRYAVRDLIYHGQLVDIFLFHRNLEGLIKYLNNHLKET